MKTTTMLNGSWKFVPTHDQRPANNQNVTENGLPLYAHPALNRTDWENVPVPGVWQRYGEKYSIYEGVCWFCREFDLAVEDTSYVKLTFKGVDYRADVYVNGAYVGWHESAYTEFSFDISKFAKNGRNFIAVQVDNRPLITKWPNDWGYGVYGGIHRDVFVEVFDGTCLTEPEVTPDYDVEKGNGVLTLAGRVRGTLPCTLCVRVGEEEHLLPCTEEQFSARVELKTVSPWSPEEPNLYDFSLSIDGDEYKEGRIGFRHVECKNRRFLLNGKETKLNGACYVYDSPRYGLVMTEDQLAEDLSKMKEAHVNAIRTHYPMDDRCYQMCDEMGFLVWIEPNVYCSKPKNDVVNTIFKQQDFVDNAVNMIREFVYTARQYACVAIYGIGNECNTEHPEARPFFEKLAETARAADSTRLVGYASLYGQIGSIGHVVDIMGANSYFGWYGTIPTFEIMDDRTQPDGTLQVREVNIPELHEMIEGMLPQLPADVPILLTEFGADSVPKFYSSACELWSENYHAKVVKTVVEESRRHPEVAGTFVFNFTDYNDPSKAVNGRWNGFNLKGMVTYGREYKLPFYALQEVYGKK